MSGADNQGVYWTLTEVLDRLRQCDPDISVPRTVDVLKELCRSGRVHARWRARQMSGGVFEPSDSFEAIPVNAWIVIRFSTPDREHYSGLVSAASLAPGKPPREVDLPRGGRVEVQFSRADVQRERQLLVDGIPLAVVAALAKAAARRPRRKPSRLMPYWAEAEAEIFRWLTENGFPLPGDRRQAVLEGHIGTWLENRGHEPSESAIRRHVQKCIAAYRRQKNPQAQGH